MDIPDIPRNSPDDVSASLLTLISSDMPGVSVEMPVSCLQSPTLSFSPHLSAVHPTTMRTRQHWTCGASNAPRDPPKGDINAIPWVPVAARPLVFTGKGCFEEVPNSPPLGAKVVDVAENKIHSDMTVVIEDGIITQVGPDTLYANHTWSSKHRIVDLDGLYLCPGLTDCRRCYIYIGPNLANSELTRSSDVHINMSDGRPASGYVDPHLRATYTLKCMLARGFTTVRDVGGATFFQKQAVEQWLTPGPRLFQGGNLRTCICSPRY